MEIIKDVGSTDTIAMLVTLILASIGSTLWISGFKMVFTETTFMYRDGFYRWHQIEINNIESAEFDLVEVGTIRRYSIPRFVIKAKDKQSAPILVNTQPFTEEGINTLQNIGNVYGQPTVQR